MPNCFKCDKVLWNTTVEFQGLICNYCWDQFKYSKTMRDTLVHIYSNDRSLIEHEIGSVYEH